MKIHCRQTRPIPGFGDTMPIDDSRPGAGVDTFSWGRSPAGTGPPQGPHSPSWPFRSGSLAHRFSPTTSMDYFTPVHCHEPGTADQGFHGAKRLLCRHSNTVGLREEHQEDHGLTISGLKQHGFWAVGWRCRMARRHGSHYRDQTSGPGASKASPSPFKHGLGGGCRRTVLLQLRLMGSGTQHGSAHARSVTHWRALAHGPHWLTVWTKSRTRKELVDTVELWQAVVGCFTISPCHSVTGALSRHVHFMHSCSNCLCRGC